jgi:hypothetical protein
MTKDWATSAESLSAIFEAASAKVSIFRRVLFTTIPAFILMD